MRKLLISLMIFMGILGLVACSVNENDSTLSVDSSGLQDESIGVKDEGEVPSKMTNFAFSPQNAGASYSCTVLWHSDNQVYGHTEKVVVRDATQKEVQTIFPEEDLTLLLQYCEENVHLQKTEKRNVLLAYGKKKTDYEL